MDITSFLHQSYTNEPHTIFTPIFQTILHNEPHAKPITARVVLPQPEPNGQESIGEQERCAVVADVVGPMNSEICLGFSL